VYWTNQDGHYSIEGATADLESLKRAGVGGVLRMDCNVPIPYGGTPYLSEAWRKQFVHSVHECERLGLEFATITGPGWTGTGGPWINAEDSMQHLVPSSVTAEGPSTFDQILPLGTPRVSPFHRDQTPEMRRQIDAFHEDVAVFAYPATPPVIGDIDERALFIRNPYTSMKGVRTHFESPRSVPAAVAGQVIDPDSIIDLTDKLAPDGRLIWDVPEGEWTIVRLTARSTGANTRPAPAAGLGLESDKFRKETVAKHFESFFDPLLKAIGPRSVGRETGFVALDADSWEMGSQNWTPAFIEAFRTQCGYDPTPYFVTYTGSIVGSREQTERFLWDVRRVCQELLLENHMAELQRLSNQRGLRLMVEPYDMSPAGDLDIGSYADYPAGEFWFDTFQSGWSCIEASSIAHTMGKPIVLAEGFTSARGNWERTPWAIKNQTDWAFAVGINKFAIHGFAHQSNEDYPGMTFGPYGLFWNRKQTFWPLVGAYHEYLARCSFLLQQGVTVSDILYLTPEGAPQVFSAPPSALVHAGSRLPDKKGYSFDGCSPRILMKRAEVKDGLLVFPGGTSYRMLVLPRFATMTPELMKTITRLVEDGAVVYGAPPVASPSLKGYLECDAEVQKMAAHLWGSSGAAAHALGKGRMVRDAGARFEDQDRASSSPLLPEFGNWLWLNEGSPEAAAPAGEARFRYTLTVPSIKDLEAARVEATADNSFTLNVNGHDILSGDNFTVIYSADLTSALQSGENTILVTAKNGGPEANPAGFIAAIRLTRADGTSQVVATDGNWQARRDGGDWAAVKVMGGGSMAPWGLKRKATSASPDLYPSYAATAAVLAQMGVRPDFESDGPIRFTHRRTDAEDIYFIANTTDQSVEATCRFRAMGAPQLWDPVTAEIRGLPDYQVEEKTTHVPIVFDAHQSFFVIFPRGPGSKTAVAASGDTNVPVVRLNRTLEGPWSLSFDPKWGGPEHVTFRTLEDWTHRAEDGIKHYSGIAVYRKTFHCPKVSGQRVFLDLGTVHEIAEVTLNGKHAGVVWCAPWRIDVTDALTVGENELEIRVANTWRNRLLGDASKPAAERLTRTAVNYKPRGPLKPSGLLGPVRIMEEGDYRISPRAGEAAKPAGTVAPKYSDGRRRP
jgi:hypothetical protein